MPRIIFWNVHKKDLTDYVCQLAESTSSDVVVLNENLVSRKQTLQALRTQVSVDFFVPKSISDKDRFHCFCRNPTLDLTEVHTGTRTSVRRLQIGSQPTLLALVHGVDVRNYDAGVRLSFAHLLAEDMRFVKREQQTSKLVMMGDFNMNPYDSGMNVAAGLNAMMTRSCVANGVRRFLGESYDFYYNPMWSLFGDNTDGPAGTVYDTSNQGPYGWSMFDQVVMNHSMVGMFRGVKILTEAGKLPLKDGLGRPDSKNASDHFPILVTMQEENDEHVLAD